MTDICVVHLVWKPLGVEPLRRFLDSYRQNPGGADHRLVVLFNGFGGERELGPWLAELEGVEHERLLTERPTQDIPAYFEAARRVECEYLCFVNSHSVILDGEWLAKFYGHASRDGVGAVGATGSWNSHYSWIQYDHLKPSAYTSVLSDVHPRSKPVSFELTEKLADNIEAAPLPARLALRLYYYGLVATYYKSVGRYRRFAERRRIARDYGAFPAYHLRTNAFMIGREVMLGLRRWEMRGKEEAWRFESGREGMTGQLLRAGLGVLVVGRDGQAYEKERWAESETLWQGQQRNLLVSDNQTRDYEFSPDANRVILSRLAWGERAAPEPRPRASQSPL
jgi:hypothetical protein